MRALRRHCSQRGVSMIEVLVTVVILTFGLLGLVGLQSRLQVSEMEAYQRAQAMILLEDMANRIATNRSAATGYVTGADSPLGAGDTCTFSGTMSRQARDSCEWSEALKGAAATIDDGATSVGAVVGGRGCIENIGSGEYLVTVAWQGQVPTNAPPAGVACGQDLYDGEEGTACTNDRCRRTITTIVRIGNLL